MRLRNSIIGVGAAVAPLATLTACSTSADPAAPNAAEEEGTYAVDENTLVFGAVPDQEATESNFKPLVNYIADITGKKVEYFEAADYVALIQAAVAGQIDVAAFSGFTYFQATQQGAKIEPFAAVSYEAGAPAGYYSVAVANPSSGITKLEQFKGQNVCFVNPNSTSGYLFPSSLLKDAGLDASEGSADLTPVFAGQHDASALKVSQGTECVAGFAQDLNADPLIASGDLVEVSRVLVPGAPLVVSSVLPPSLKQQIIDALTGVTIDDLIAAGVEGADGEGFAAVFNNTEKVDDSYYDTIRALCANVPGVEACQS